MKARGGALASTLLCTMVIATGCGGSGGSKTSVSSTKPIDVSARELSRRAAALASLSAAASSSDVGSEASRPPRTIFDDAAIALLHAHSFITTTTFDSHPVAGRVEIIGDRYGDIEVRRRSFDGGYVDAIFIGRSLYQMGNERFFIDGGNAKQVALTLVGLWLKVAPSRQPRLVVDLLANWLNTPSTQADCLAEDNGTVTKKTVMINGVPAISLTAAGNVPGTGAGVALIAGEGAPYPLSEALRGTFRPGGHIDQCNDGKGVTAANAIAAVITYSEIGKVPRIMPPPSSVPFS